MSQLVACQDSHRRNVFSMCRYDSHGHSTHVMRRHNLRGEMFEGNQHEEDQELSHSNLTLRYHLQSPSHKNMPLNSWSKFSVRWTYDRLTIPAPSPFSPFSSSSSSRKLRGILAAIVDTRESLMPFEAAVSRNTASAKISL